MSRVVATTTVDHYGETIGRVDVHTQPQTVQAVSYVHHANETPPGFDPIPAARTCYSGYGEAVAWLKERAA